MARAEEPTSSTSVAAGPLRAFIQRIERCAADKAEAAEDMKQVYEEAKSAGFDTNTIRRIIGLRKLTADERSEQEALLDLYQSALGMLANTPLGIHAAVTAAAKGLGRPADLTPEEEAAGVIAAFDNDGTRMTITPGGVPKAA